MSFKCLRRCFHLSVLSVLFMNVTSTAQAWTPIWNGEFNGSDLDPNYWVKENRDTGWINAEAQSYTDRRENVRTENGNLVLEARRDWAKGEYTSGRIRSARSFTYGRMEARIQLPGGVGTWPAFFLLPDDQTFGWPKMGELDILEQVGFDPDTVLSAHHSQSVHSTGTRHVPGATTGFHDYAVEWFPDHIDTFVDGQKIFTTRNQNTGYDQWPFNKSYHIVLTLAVGGNWGGQHGIDPNIWPRRMLVDYVRVYGF